MIMHIVINNLQNVFDSHPLTVNFVEKCAGQKFTRKKVWELEFHWININTSNVT